VVVRLVTGRCANVGIVARTRRTRGLVDPRLGQVQDVVVVGVATDEERNHALVIADLDVPQRHVAGIGHRVGPCHRGALEDLAAVCTVGGLDDVDRRIAAKVGAVVGVVGRLRVAVVVRVVTRRCADVGVVARTRRTAGFIDPRLAQVQDAVVVGITTDVDRYHTPVITDVDVRQRHVAGIRHLVAPLYVVKRIRTNGVLD